MKKLTTLLFLFFLGLNQNVKAQIQSYYCYGDSIIGCQNTIGGYIYCGNLDETGGYVTINWGDGNTDNLPVNIAANNGFSFEQYHTYSIPGTYFVDVQVYSGTSAAIVGTGYQVDLLSLSPTSCGMFYGYVYQNVPNLYYWDVPLDCTGADGITTTITPATYYYGNYSGLNPSNAPYIVQVNSDWLNNNGYIQVTSNQTINSFNPDGLADVGQMVFEITCDVPASNPDFSVDWVWPGAFVAPLQTGTLYAEVCNLACSDTSDVTLSLNFPAGFVPNTSGLTNPVVNGNNLTFLVNDLTNCIYLNIPFTFPGTTQAGTFICFDLNAYNALDSDISNNSYVQCTYVLNSYDPNSKEVDHPEQIDPSTQETLRYMVHFQNDGNFSAMNVEIIDTLSTNLDLTTFRLISSDHGVAFTIDPLTRVVRFVFNNIDLVPSSVDLSASQGYVLYEIQEISGLGEGDDIENTANIYFDYNPAIVTNTTYNLNTALGLQEDSKHPISIYPNPAQNSLNIEGSENSLVQITDVSGKIVLSHKLANIEAIDISSVTDGIYTVIVFSEFGRTQFKLVVKK